MKRIGSVLGVLLVLAVGLAFGALRFWNVFGQARLGGACDTRAGCRSFQCLHHVRVASGGERAVDKGYCTGPCERDADCADGPGLRCVVPTSVALDDLPKYGRPTRLCERTE